MIADISETDEPNLNGMCSRRRWTGKGQRGVKSGGDVQMMSGRMVCHGGGRWWADELEAKWMTRGKEVISPLFDIPRDLDEMGKTRRKRLGLLDKINC